ncbi:YsnF/AvaK domain-containing protein [Modestobacter lacusdianchii]
MDVVVSEERLRVSTLAEPVERVIIGKRVVTETRTLTVEVRREELYTERLAADGGSAADGRSQDEIVLVLHEEVPDVVLTVVPTERVHLSRVQLTEEVPITGAVRRERVEVDRTDQP